MNTKARPLRIGFYLLVGILVGAPALLASFAAKARSHHHHGGRLTHVHAPHVSVPVVKHDDLAGVRKGEDHRPSKIEGSTEKAHGGATVSAPPGNRGQGAKENVLGNDEAGTGGGPKNPNAPDIRMKGLGPVDTQITTEPPPQGTKPGLTRQVKSKIPPNALKHLRVRHVFVPRKNKPPIRNAIGIPIVPPPTGTKGPDKGSAGLPGGINSGVTYAPVKPNPGSDRLDASRPNAAAVPSVPRSGVGTLNGSDFTHRGFVPATLGGQAKFVGGISGSMIRPKY
jgi:hypothetical protein